MTNEIPRVVTRVTKTDGSTVNVRNDEMDAFIAANPGAVAVEAEAEPEAEPEAADPEAEEKAPPMRGRATTSESAKE